MTLSGLESKEDYCASLPHALFRVLFHKKVHGFSYVLKLPMLKAETIETGPLSHLQPNPLAQAAHTFGI